MTVYLAEDFDFSHVKDHQLDCLPGIVAVEMLPRPEKSKGGLILTDNLKSEMRSDLAVVIGSGVDLPVGKAVYVRYDRGKCVDGFGWEEPTARSEVRFYGINGGIDFAHTGSNTRPNQYPWWDAVLCDSDMRPLGKNVLVKLAEKPEETNGVLLRKQDTQRDPVADVVAVGSMCEYIKEGDKVVFHEGAIDSQKTALLHGEGWEDHAIVSEEFIYARRK